VTFVPAVALTGAVFVTLTSALKVIAAIVVCELFDVSGSKLPVVALAVFVTLVVFPTRTTSVNAVEPPFGMASYEQTIVPVPPTAGVAQIGATPEVGVNETNVVPGGTTSVRMTSVAGSGPPFVKVIAYVRFVPETPAGGPVFVTTMFAFDTAVVIVAVLFSSFGSFAVATVDVFTNCVPDAVPAGMCPVSVNVVVELPGMLALVQVIVPPAPTAGVVQANGTPVCVRETNVIVPGSVSVSVTSPDAVVLECATRIV
jgi:hypothetical protein